jgi:hypothetical protein
MNNRAHVWPRFIDARVQVEFKRWLAFALDQIAVQIDEANIVSGQSTAL